MTAPVRSASVSVQCQKFALLRFAWLRSAPISVELPNQSPPSEKLELARFAQLRSAPVSVAPLKSVLARFWPAKLQPVRSLPAKRIPDRS